MSGQGHWPPLQPPQIITPNLRDPAQSTDCSIRQRFAAKIAVRVLSCARRHEPYPGSDFDQRREPSIDHALGDWVSVNSDPSCKLNAVRTPGNGCETQPPRLSRNLAVLIHAWVPEKGTVKMFCRTTARPP